MSQRMVESMSQQDFYGDLGMHYMALQAMLGLYNILDGKVQ
jgi:hypothetical protein